MSPAIRTLEKNQEIISGCQVTWKRDFEFRRLHQGQLGLFFKKYGYGPFFVKSVRRVGEHCFVTISTEEGEAEIDAYYLQKVRTFASLEEMNNALADMATD